MNANTPWSIELEKIQKSRNKFKQIITGDLSIQFDEPKLKRFPTQIGLYSLLQAELNCKKRALRLRGEVNTIAGCADGGYCEFHNSKLSFPRFMALNNQGELFISDECNHCIRRVRPSSSEIRESAERVAGTPRIRGYQDGPGNEAQFYHPRGLVFNSVGDLFVCDCWNHCIRKIEFRSGQAEVTTFAGTPQMFGFSDGEGTDAKLCNPTGITIDSKDNLYFCDRGNYCIRKVSPEGMVSTIAGTGRKGDREGPLLAAEFVTLWDITINRDNEQELYITDSLVHKVKKLSLREGLVSSIAGAGEGYCDDKSHSQFNYPTGVYYYNNELFVADLLNYSIRKIDLTTGVVTTFAGIPRPLTVKDPQCFIEYHFTYPQGVIGFHHHSHSLYVSDLHSIRKVT